MKDLDYCAHLADQLTRGFDERIEYDLRIMAHTKDCLAGRNGWGECPCPYTLEKRVKTVRHAPLIAQLGAAVSEAPAASGGDSRRSATRVDSPFPGDFEALALLDELKRSLSSYVRRARQILGYDVPPSSIVQGAVCGRCAGTLKLHNGEAVCMGLIGESPPCGMKYVWQEIEDYLRGLNEQG